MINDIPAGSFTIDPAHTRLGFSARHAMVSRVRGAFNDIQGGGYFDPVHEVLSNIEITVKAESIDTRNPDRDAHLRSNDFLDMANYPTITFKSTRVAPKSGSTLQVDGDLTIRGISKPVSINFDYSGAATDPYGNDRVAFEGSLVINRKDWGVEWNAPLEAGGVLVGEKVTLEFEIAAILVKVSDLEKVSA